MSKKIKNIIIFSVLGAVVLAIAIFSLVSYLKYADYRHSMESATALISFLIIR